MIRRRVACVFVALLGSWLFAAPAQAGTKLLRYPDVHGEKVVFAYAGDLWSASTQGGAATRLTAHPGVETFPRFSPDGSRIAFTGQYDGDEQVYVIPSGGGVPRQLTFYPALGPLPPRWGTDNQVYDWTPDGASVLFRSLRYGSGVGDGRLFTVAVEGGLPEPLPMPESGAGDLSPDGRLVVYAPLSRDFRTWKRYQGGWAQDLYVFDPQSHEVEQVTADPRTDRDPMWIGDKIYFASDRDGKLNLYAYDTGSKRTEQLTESTTWDVRWPADDGRARIVYELDGELQLYDIASDSSRALDIVVPDDGLSARPARVSAAGLIEDFGLSPRGERALFVARGDVFSAPLESGPTRNLTRSSGAHDKWARWSPDGAQIAFVSDRDGEEEIWLVAQDGSGEPAQLTDGGSAMRYAAEWSPDGKRLAFGDKDGKLWVLDVASRELSEIADEASGQIRDYVWSPHGGHLAFTLTDANSYGSIWIWSVADAGLRRVTDEMFNEFNPAWGANGDYLFYISDREFAPQIASIEWNYATDRESGIFALALRADVAHPFPPKSDEVTLDGEDDEGDDDAEDGKKKKGKKGDKEGDDEKKKAPPYIEIDFDGLGRRVARVPVESDNYFGLAAVEGHLLFGRGAPFYYGRRADVKPALQLFVMEDRETKTLVEGVSGYTLSQDGKKVLVREGSSFKLYDVKPGAEGEAVSTGGLMVDRVPREEWAQIFDEVWRRFRDFFYVENMHGYDWDGLRERYRPQLEHVGHRADLNYVIGEMIAELSVSHAYIAGGDIELPDRPQVALPGALFELDREADRYRIAKVFRGHNEEDRYRAPLAEVGIEAREGDYLLAIDGDAIHGGENPYARLRHKAGLPVELTLNDRPSTDGAHTVKFRPVTSESALRYLDWVETNRRKVAEMTDGRVGYLHIPDMGSNGIREFIKWFYGQIRREGMVIDVRGNGGGNVSQMVIERLRRDLLGTRFARTSDRPGTYPAWVFHGPLVCLLDEDSASDGDIFPHMFRQAGLGPLIGKRSWGGVVGITNRGTLIDGGSVNVPEFGTNGVDGDWVIEGHGVDPDIEVDNDPASLLAGGDPQLERAVQEVLRRMEEQPMRLPTRPADPVKTD